ncbi:MAG: hypothetical protein ACREE2_03585 [Stellaceae bacterium]
MRPSRRGPSFFAVVIGTALAGCAALAPSGEHVTTGLPAGVVMREHLSGRFIELIGLKAQHAAPFLGTPDTNFYCLRSFIDRKTGASADQLYVADSYDGAERRWSAAYDTSGHALPFIAISRNRITCAADCTYAEEFAANLPEHQLRESPRGFAVTFTDHAGDHETIDVTADQIAAQLAALAAEADAVAVMGARTALPPAETHQP